MDGLSIKYKKNIINKWDKLLFSYKKNKKNWNNLLESELPKSNLFFYKKSNLLDDLLNKHFVFPLYKKNCLKSINLNKLTLNLKNFFTLVYINGKFSRLLTNKLNNINSLPFEIKILRKNFYLFSPIKKNFFLYLIDNLIKEQSIIKISNKLNNKIYILNLIFSNIENKLNNSFFRQHFHIEKKSKVQIIENYVHLDDNYHFIGSRFTINSDSHAKINHTKIISTNLKSYHITFNDTILSKNNVFKSFFYFSGQNLIDQNINIQLKNKNSQLILKSLALSEKKEFIIINSYLEHIASHCTSYQIYKNIINEKAENNFSGMIKVSKKSYKTDGKLINNNLLIGDFSKIYTKPKLKIYNEDVKCSHGTTIGNIDKNQIMFLRSRGIKKNIAKNMIIIAFAFSLIEDIQDIILKKFILNEISTKLQGIKDVI